MILLLLLHRVVAYATGGLAFLAKDGVSTVLCYPIGQVEGYQSTLIKYLTALDDKGVANGDVLQVTGNQGIGVVHDLVPCSCCVVFR